MDVEQEFPHIGARVAYARACRGYTRRTLAKYLPGYSDRNLEAYEQGRRSWPHELLATVAYALDVPLRWLQEGWGEVPVKPPSKEELLQLGRMPARAREAGLRARMRSRPRMVSMKSAF